LVDIARAAEGEPEAAQRVGAGGDGRADREPEERRDPAPGGGHYRSGEHDATGDSRDMVTEQQMPVYRHEIARIGAGLSRCTIIFFEAENVERQQFRVEAVAKGERHGQHGDQDQGIHGDVTVVIVFPPSLRR
jgi:hypothetical protein